MGESNSRLCSFSQHPFLPSSWMAKATTALAGQNYQEYLFQVFLLTSTALFLGNIVYLFTYKYYRIGWNKVHSHTIKKGHRKHSWISKFTKCFMFLSPQDKTFLEKDIKIFIRESSTMGQFGVLLGLLLLYIPKPKKLPI